MTTWRQRFSRSQFLLFSEMLGTCSAQNLLSYKDLKSTATPEKPDSLPFDLTPAPCRCLLRSGTGPFCSLLSLLKF